MEEKTFFEYEDVKVTNARFLSGSQTYAMSNVTSVKAMTQKPNRLWWIALFLIGLIVAANSSFGGGAVMVLVAVAALWLQKTTYHVMLTTSGGETSALKTYQLDYVTKVIKALNDAIVHRG